MSDKELWEQVQDLAQDLIHDCACPKNAPTTIAKCHTKCGLVVTFSNTATIFCGVCYPDAHMSERRP